MHHIHGDDHEDLVEFLISQGHSEERAKQIAGNHPDAVRAEMKQPKETAATSGSNRRVEDRPAREETAAEEAAREASEQAEEDEEDVQP
jgi:hypothetical protein